MGGEEYGMEGTPGSGGGDGNSGNGLPGDGNPWENPADCHGFGPDGCPPVLTAPVLEPVMVKKPCEKIQTLFTDFPDYKNELVALAAKTSETVENGIFLDEAEETPGNNPAEDVPVGTNGRIDLPPCPTDNYISIAHTHNSPADDTYSIFSLDDLALFARSLHCGRLKANKFVAFLMTANGTYYALVIDKPSKLKKVFGYFGDFGQGGVFDEEDVKSYEKVADIKKEYYTGFDTKDSPKIKEDSNNTTDKEIFLKMLGEEDMGLALLKSDATFQDFSRLSLNGDTVVEEDCTE